MISWIRIARGIGDDPKVHELAEQTGADVVAVVGHLVLLFGQMADHAKDGVVARVPDTALERWAGWTGKRGRFAAPFRALLCTDGVVSAWEKHNGAAIQKADADAERLRERRKAAARASRDGSATRPATDARASRVDVTRRNGTNYELPPEPTTQQEVPQPPGPDAPAAGDFAALWARYPARDGSNPRRDAERAYRARRREGYTDAVLGAGLDRYVAWCEARRKIGTEGVMQAVTFFGPSHRFLEPWTIDAPPAASAPRAGDPPPPDQILGDNLWPTPAALEYLAR